MLGCTPVTTERWGYHNYPDELSYCVATSQASPRGIRFDATSQDISGALLDRLTEEVEMCVHKSIDRTSFVVKVPANWTLNCAGTQQVLMSRAPEDGCLAKGQKYDPKCPCRWRARIQWPNVIVTTPSLYLYKDALTRFVTGSNNPWSDPTLAACASPSTGPLSPGH